MGNNVKVLCDVGVAGIHRLLRNKKDISAARVIIVIAGMEGGTCQCGRRNGGLVLLSACRQVLDMAPVLEALLLSWQC
jgi:hypothetical protein